MKDQLTGWSGGVKLVLIRDKIKCLIRTKSKIYISAVSKNLYVSVRSSATVEDLPDASFTDQQGTFVNVTG